MVNHGNGTIVVQEIAKIDQNAQKSAILTNKKTPLKRGVSCYLLANYMIFQVFTYLPMQKRVKMFWRMSAVVILPVIDERWFMVSRRS